MLVRFRSTATESITMFGDAAVALIRMMGATGNVPGAFSAEDVPAALARLRTEVAAARAVPEPAPQDRSRDKEDEDEKEKQPPVSLSMRAVPLIQLLERAAAAKAEIMWEAA